MGKAHADPKDKDGQTPLASAARSGHTEVAKLFLGATGVDADSRDGEGLTPLAWAARNGHEKLVELFLSVRDVNPNSETDDPWPGRMPPYLHRK